MDLCQNVMVSGDFHHQQEQVLGASFASLDDLFRTYNMEEDMSLEWLSVFVDDCFSSTGNCLQLFAGPVPTAGNHAPSAAAKQSARQEEKPRKKTLYTQKFEIPVKARSKRKRITGTKIRTQLTSWSSECPPLLQQAYWLADSELMSSKEENSKAKMGINCEVIQEGEEKVAVTRKCSHCQTQKTPQWRAGPMGPKTLCNACGVRNKSGRLFPEYRPAKSPTFVSYLHSNSHKKVLEMRMNSS